MVKHVFLFLLVPVATLFAAIWVLPLSALAANEDVLLPKDVKLVKVQRGTIDQQVTARGQVVLDSIWPVIPKLNGRVKSILLNVGDPVKKGQKLALIEADPAFVDKVDEAVFNIKRLKLQISELVENIDNEEALLKNRVSSENRLQTLQRGLALKKNELNFWQSKFQRCGQQAGRSYSLDQPVSANAFVKSPASGILLESHIKPNHHTRPYLDNGSPLFTIGDLKQLYLIANISQIDLSKLHLEDKVRMRFDGISGKVFSGRISRIPIQSEPNPQLTIPFFHVEVQFDSLSDDLKIGMTCDLNILVARKTNTIVVDASAIYFKNEPGVFVLGASGLQFRPVNLGIEGTSKVEILSGLKAGETVVLDALEAAKKLDF
jgi:RND family efflux transporter MFP subunit